jgi:hypothetical protein
VLTLTLAEPMTAAILASIVLHQTIGTAGWIGVAVVLAALLITARSGDSQPAAATIDMAIAGHMFVGYDPDEPVTVPLTVVRADPTLGAALSTEQAAKLALSQPHA